MSCDIYNYSKFCEVQNILSPRRSKDTLCPAKSKKSLSSGESGSSRTCSKSLLLRKLSRVPWGKSYALVKSATFRYPTDSNSAEDRNCASYHKYTCDVLVWPDIDFIYFKCSFLSPCVKEIFFFFFSFFFFFFFLSSFFFFLSFLCFVY